MRSRVYAVPSARFCPQNKFFCVGKIADYKRRKIVRLRVGIHPEAGRRLTKPYGFVVCRFFETANVRLRRTQPPCLYCLKFVTLL